MRAVFCDYTVNPCEKMQLIVIILSTRVRKWRHLLILNQDLEQGKLMAAVNSQK